MPIQNIFGPDETFLQQRKSSKKGTATGSVLNNPAIPLTFNALGRRPEEANRSSLLGMRCSTGQRTQRPRPRPRRCTAALPATSTSRGSGGKRQTQLGAPPNLHSIGCPVSSGAIVIENTYECAVKRRGSRGHATEVLQKKK